MGLWRILLRFGEWPWGGGGGGERGQRGGGYIMGCISFDDIFDIYLYGYIYI